MITVGCFGYVCNFTYRKDLEMCLFLLNVSLEYIGVILFYLLFCIIEIFLIKDERNEIKNSMIERVDKI